MIYYLHMKQLLFLTIGVSVLLTAGCASTKTQITQNTNTVNTNIINTNPVVDTQEQICVASGGTWREFSNGCADSCAAQNDTSTYCTQAFTYGCDCGAAQCWDDETSDCTNNSEKIINPLPERAGDLTTTMTTTNSGLQYQDTVIGTGSEANPGDTVTVHYTGTLDDGTVFDTSYKRNQPFTFKLGAGSVIAGWDEGVAGMAVGGKRTLIIPPDLGYGNQAIGSIPAGSTLHFEVEVIEIQP